MICQVEGCTEHYGCRLRAKSISLSSAATPSRKLDRKFKPRPIQQPSWEKGVEGEYRSDGSFMPVLNDKGKRMGVYEAQSNRKRIDAMRRRYASSTPLED